MQRIADFQNEEFSCAYQKECSGCSWIGQPLHQQQSKKVENFRLVAAPLWNKIPEIEVHSLGPGHLRERLDFTLKKGALGLQRIDSSEMVDLTQCPQMTNDLNDFLEQFRKVQLPIQKGSVRLRVGPTGLRGAWLDFAHVDVKRLFDEQTQLRKLLEFCFVEIGQRRKKLEIRGGQLKLNDPESQIWTSTFSAGYEVHLESFVGSFTQTGRPATLQFSKLLEKLLGQIKPKIGFDYGAGIGTLTIPALSFLQELQIWETDPLACQVLQKTLHKYSHLKSKVRFAQKPQRSPSDEPLSGPVDFILLNPPRSGAAEFLRTHVAKTVENIVYMSCFAESLVQDGVKLQEQGFQLQEIHMIDQFPQTPHAEWMTWWSRSLT